MEVVGWVCGEGRKRRERKRKPHSEEESSNGQLKKRGEGGARMGWSHTGPVCVCVEMSVLPSSSAHCNPETERGGEAWPQ